MDSEMLIGYLNPGEKYPSIVIPVIQARDGKQAVVRRPNSRLLVEYFPLADGEEFQKPEFDLRGSAEPFDPVRHRLLAMCPARVLRYKICEERSVLQQELDRNNRDGEDAFARLSLAKLTCSSQHVLRELASTALEFLAQTAHFHGVQSLRAFVEPWYSVQISDIESRLGSRDEQELLDWQENAPCDWEDFLATDWMRRTLSAKSTRGLDYEEMKIVVEAGYAMAAQLFMNIRSRGS